LLSDKLDFIELVILSRVSQLESVIVAIAARIKNFDFFIMSPCGFFSFMMFQIEKSVI
jgi:hypothetical protein